MDADLDSRLNAGQRVLPGEATKRNPSSPSVNVVIQAQNASLRIPVFSMERRSLKKALVSTLTGGVLGKSRGGSYVDSLINISCTICHGERIALIGHNGAGKSTFLRLISGIYAPTSGSIVRSCTVFPMINKSFVTSAELSGLEAVKAHYLLLHQNLRGFDSYLDGVIEFSGLGEFIRLPIKTYSEGMAARLLFSFLTATSHECLAIDEGFGAGDSQFYERAEKRLKTFIESSGTLILASHSDDLLRQFCTRGLVFSHGQIVYDADLELALDYYHHHHA